MDEERINRAVRECLRSYYKKSGITEQVKDYLSGLRAEGWTEDQIKAVEQGIVKNLYGTAADSDEQLDDAG